MKPVVDRLGQTYAGRIEFQVFPTLDTVEAGNDLASEHGVSAVPTMMLVAPDGTEVGRWVGARPESELVAALEAQAAGR